MLRGRALISALAALLPLEVVAQGTDEGLGNSDFCAYLARTNEQGCLLGNDGTGPHSSKSVMITHDGPSGGGMAVFLDADRPGDCAFGSKKRQCTKIDLKPDVLRAIRAQCPAVSVCVPARFATPGGGIWLSGTTLFQHLVRQGVEGYETVEIGQRLAALSAPADPEGVAATTLVFETGGVVNLNATTPAARNRDLDLLADAIAALPFAPADIEFVGAKDFLVAGGRLYQIGRGERGALRTALELQSHVQTLHAQVPLEDLGSTNWTQVHQHLMLRLVDPDFSSQVLRRQRMTLHPALYLLN